MQQAIGGYPHHLLQCWVHFLFVRNSPQGISLTKRVSQNKNEFNHPVGATENLGGLAEKLNSLGTIYNERKAESSQILYENRNLCSGFCDARGEVRRCRIQRKTLCTVTAFIDEKAYKNNHQRVPDTTIGPGETSKNVDTDDYKPILNNQKKDVKQRFA